MDVELVRSHADDLHVEDEVLVRALGQLRDEARLRPDRRRVELQLLEAGAPDLALFDRHDLLAVGGVEAHEEGVAGTVLVERDRLRRARVGVGGPARLALGRGVPVPEREVVEVGRGDLLGRDHDLVAVRLALDRERRMEQPDVPRGPVVLRRVEALQRRVWRALRGEAPAVDDDVERLEMDVGMVRVQHGHEVRADRAGHRRQVVGAVDRGAVVDIVGTGGDDHPDARVHEPLQLRGGALDGALGLDVGVEQVARDQDEVHLFTEREIDRRNERRELALTLGRRTITQVRVARAQMHVGRVEQSQHRSANPPPAPRGR